MRFVDTSFLVALQFARDEHASAAQTLWSREHGPLVTTNHVLGETWTFLRRRLHHAAARDFHDRVARSNRVSVVHVDEDSEQAAWRWLHRHDERPYSFVDASSFVVMRRHRIAEALAFDGDFTAAGFVEVRP